MTVGATTWTKNGMSRVGTPILEDATILQLESPRTYSKLVYEASKAGQRKTPPFSNSRCTIRKKGKKYIYIFMFISTVDCSVSSFFQQSLDDEESIVAASQGTTEKSDIGYCLVGISKSI
jgi:hypothetical protein